MRRAVSLVVLLLLAGCGSSARTPPPPVKPAGPIPPAQSLPVRGEGPPPLSEGQALSRIAFGWGADQSGDLPIFAAVTAARPDLFLFAGGNLRPDRARIEGSDQSDQARLHWAYGEMNLNAHFAAFNMSTPVLATWDAADSGGTEADRSLREFSEAAFESYWGAGAMGTGGPGVFGARVFGPPGRRVQILMLDVWSFRSAGPVRRSQQAGLLGAAQWRWLAEELRRPAELRLIVSPMPILSETTGWAEFPRERRRLLRAVEASGANGLIAVSGGGHPGTAQARRGPSREVTTAALSGSTPGFGLVEIDWASRTLTLSERGLEGAPRRSSQTRFADPGL